MCQNLTICPTVTVYLVAQTLCGSIIWPVTLFIKANLTGHVAYTVVVLFKSHPLEDMCRQFCRAKPIRITREGDTRRAVGRAYRRM